MNPARLVQEGGQISAGDQKSQEEALRMVADAVTRSSRASASLADAVKRLGKMKPGEAKLLEDQSESKTLKQIVNRLASLQAIARYVDRSIKD